jgi:hypothetical protein
MADDFELSKRGDDEKVKSTEKLRENMLGGFAKSTRNSTWSYRGNGAAELGNSSSVMALGLRLLRFEITRGESLE